MFIHSNRFWEQKFGLAKQVIFGENNTAEQTRPAVFPMRMLPKSILNRVPVNQYTPGKPVL